MDNRTHDFERKTDYQPQDFEEVGGESHSHSSRVPLGFFERIRRKHISTLFLLVLLSWGGYHFLSRIMSKPIKASSKPIAKPWVRSSSKPRVNTSISQTPTTNTPRAVPNIQRATAEIPDQQLVKEKKSLTGLEEQLDKTQIHLDRLSFQMTTLQTSLSTMDSQLSYLRDIVQPMSQWYKQQLQKERLQKQQQTISKTAPSPRYHLHALIPGRAWLIAKDGQVLTVSVGDNLPGLGSVKLIDTQQGLVHFSTGSSIGYSTEDR